MTIKNRSDKFPERYRSIWKKCRPLLKAGRMGDLEHAQETAQFILNYRGRLKLDKDILVPVALMHDIGHYAILPEHFKFVTGPEKIMNGKLVHMLSGAKIAKDILTKAHYNPIKTQEIVEIISIHDADQLQGVDPKKIYNSANKRIFHDIDSLDRYTEARLKSFAALYPNRQEFLKLLTGYMKQFFYPEFKKLATSRLNFLKEGGVKKRAQK